MVLLLAGVVMGFTRLPDLSTIASFCVLLAKQQAAVLAKRHMESEYLYLHRDMLLM